MHEALLRVLNAARLAAERESLNLYPRARPEQQAAIRERLLRDAAEEIQAQAARHSR